MNTTRYFSRRSFLKAGTALAAASIITPQRLFGSPNNINIVISLKSR